MKQILEKLSSYNIFNYLFPGILFVLILDKLTPYSFVQDDIILGLFLYYFIGLVISRIGSLVVEPFFKAVSFIKFSEYKDFVAAARSDPKIDLLSEVNNMYRTISALFIVILVLILYSSIEDILPVLKDASVLVLIIVLLIVFILSYRKQTKYIVKRIKAAKDKE